MHNDRDYGDETDDYDFSEAAVDAVARLRAVVDIGVMDMAEHARLVSTYYGKLLEYGLPENVAVAFAAGFQSVYFQSLLA